MSTTSSATTTLYVNGRPAQDELARLRGELDKYKKQLLDIAADPSKGLGSQQWNSTLKKVKATEKELEKVKSNVASVSQTLTRLDKATPKELRQALRQLNKELADIERGSKAWDEQVKKIRAVKTELAKINDETRKHENLWSRFAKKMFDWGSAIQTVMATVTGITMTARQAVKAYAEMDQEMANVRKFTGMTAEQVADLNEEFKHMDTRTTREGLNQLAQEAGRLGKQSKEDVMGFVRAADQINVALDDLGEGATLTLSKLTGLFGDEARYGTEQSLLKVGSVINELSQNCSASAPYIAEFASRLGGVGAQAHMSVQQIMAYGAVLDTAQQKVEASSTALSQLIVKLYRDPAKYAKAAGLDVKKFTELMKKDANEAVLTLLDTLNKAGGMDVLAPMFADMGENGSRSVQTLSVLAGKIDEVRAQQDAANLAFAEGTSVTQEFNVQNNTVQAGLEKAKKSFNEMAVLLGEKLAPAMKYAITSSAAMMKALSVTVDFFVKYRVAITAITLTIVAYNIAVKAAAISTKMINGLVAAGRAIVAAATVAWKGLTVVWYLMTLRINEAAKAWAAMNAIMKTNAIAMAVATVVALVAALAALATKTNENVKAMKDLKKIREDAKKTMVDEQMQIQRLVDAARDEKLSLEDRQIAIKKLNEIIPDYNAQLDATTGKYKENTKALNDYLTALARKYELEGAKDMLAEIGKELAEARVQADKAQQDYDRERRDVPGPIDPEYGPISNVMRVGRAKSAVNDANNKVKILEGRRAAIEKVYGVDLEKDAVKQQGNTQPETTTTTYATPADDKNKTTQGHEDKFKAEKQWRTEQDALNKIAYLKGEKDYEAYAKRMDEIAVEFYDKQLARTDLTQTERLTIQSQYYEATRKQQETANSLTAEDEDRAYAERLAELRQSFIDGSVTRDEYNRQTELEELEHLRRMDQIQAAAAKGSNDPAVLQRARQAHEAYQQKLLTNQDKMRKAAEEREKEYLKRLGDTWQQYFVTDEEKKQEQYKLGLQMLDSVYANEVKAAAGNAAAKLEIDKRYAKARKKLYDEIFNNEKTGQKSWEQWIGGAMDKIFGEGTWDKYGAVVKQAFASMTSMMQSFSQLAQAEAEIRLARLEKQYDREISMAEGNNRKVKALERKKEKETARIKADAQRKEFAQQVMNAISSTALAAINAYASAAKIAWWLGPVAAGMALAAGAVQVAAIKKQQEASEVKGFAQGGFTPDGPKDKPVGVVHAGEWVASQKLLANPVARPMIEALDYAQRNNTLGSLQPDDVSRSITAPTVIAGAAQDRQLGQTMVAVAAALGNYDNTMARLNDRLNEPFVTVNTVTGDMGIKQAQDEYQRLMNNTLPKSKRS